MVNRMPVRDRAGRAGVAERPVVPLKPGNAGGGKGLSSRPTQDVVRDLEIGQPSNSEKCSETADGVTKRRRKPAIASTLRSRAWRRKYRKAHSSVHHLAIPRSAKSPGLGYDRLNWCTPLPRTDLVPICEVMLFAGALTMHTWILVVTIFPRNDKDFFVETGSSR